MKKIAMNGSDAFKSPSEIIPSAESSLTRKLLYEEEMVRNSINPRFSMNQSSEPELVKIIQVTSAMPVLK